jgi:hypothetical protein
MICDMLMSNRPKDEGMLKKIGASNLCLEVNLGTKKAKLKHLKAAENSNGKREAQYRQQQERRTNQKLY